MIGKLKGIVDSVEEEGLILDVNGVGYLVSASARTLRALPASGAPAELLIETHVREDAIRLYGFLTASERDWFRLLQNVQGVGAKVALGILGALSAEALSVAVARQDKAMMARAPGVGPKLAARLVLELKDKAPALAPPISPTRKRVSSARPGSPRRRRTRFSPWSGSATLNRRPRPPWRGFRPGSDRKPRRRPSSARASRNWRNRPFYVIVIDARKVKRMTAASTISSKYQISIPKEVRDHLVGLAAWPRRSHLSTRPRRFDRFPCRIARPSSGMARGANIGQLSRPQ